MGHEGIRQTESQMIGSTSTKPDSSCKSSLTPSTAMPIFKWSYVIDNCVTLLPLSAGAVAFHWQPRGYASEATCLTTVCPHGYSPLCKVERCSAICYNVHSQDVARLASLGLLYWSCPVILSSKSEFLYMFLRYFDPVNIIVRCKNNFLFGWGNQCLG